MCRLVALVEIVVLVVTKNKGHNEEWQKNNPVTFSSFSSFLWCNFAKRKSMSGNIGLFTKENVSEELQSIAKKVFAGKRITDEEGLLLFEKGSLPFLGTLANRV